MCGIIGQFFLDPQKTSDHRIVSALDAIEHRGPDNKTFFNAPGISFGHVRLSIIDLSDKAHQPFTNEAKTHVLCFNGEIYNYLELKKNLEKRGCHFETQSDTEVLFHLLRLDWVDGLNQLNGFFALGFYDLKAKKGFIARDRMGIKPLAYYSDNEGFHFSNSCKSLKILKPELMIDSNVIQHYLRFNYIPGPKSIFKDVKKVKPGHAIVFEGNIISHHAINFDSSKVKKDIKTLLDESVKLRLQSDVPVGCFLSGGIDSSIIAALAKQHKPDLKTFSIGFETGTVFDESKYAEEVAHHLDTDHTTIKIDDTSLLKSIDGIIDALDEPFADSSSIALYNLCAYVKPHVSVVLSGDGADELFGGYSKHKALFMSLNPSSKVKLATRLGHLLPSQGNRSGKIGNKLRQLKKMSDGLKLSEQERYIRWASFATEDQIKDLTKGETEPLYMDQAWTGDFMDFLKMDQELVLVNDMLVKVDQMSMGHALEVRVPFLDTHVVDHAHSLSASNIINSATGKNNLREAFKDILPGSVFNRPKHGFEVPLSRWINTALKDQIDHYLSKGVCMKYGLIDYKAAERLRALSKNKSSGDSIYQVWAIFVLHKWIEKHCYA